MNRFGSRWMTVVWVVSAGCCCFSGGPGDVPGVLQMLETERGRSSPGHDLDRPSWRWRHQSVAAGAVQRRHRKSDTHARSVCCSARAVALNRTWYV